MTTKKSKTNRLEPRDWERAALDMIADKGLAALSIPKLAAHLNVTKGSFYWHFEGLDVFLIAALTRWERSYTDRRIERFEEEFSSPSDRLKPWSVEAEVDHKAQALYLEISNASATRPEFANVVSRVVRKRTSFLERAFRHLGFSTHVAKRRAIITYSAYVGMLHLTRVAPEAIGSSKKRSATVREAMRLFSRR